MTMTTSIQQQVEDAELFKYRLKELEERYRKQALAMACTLVSLVDLRDSYTGGHSGRVASYTRTTAVRLGLNDTAIDEVVMAALMHDIGKIGVPDHVLLKPGKLTSEEFAQIKKHPELGWMALKNMNDFKSISLVVLHHHERFDGYGYPAGLEGNEVPLGSRIIAVADSFDAMTTNRPYRQAMSQFTAVEELEKCRGTQFDSRVLDAFIGSLI
jgi:HD-GYP domain-containing protein (c-di-GMP phosphodiesterase class II)